MVLNCDIGEDSWESLGLQPVHPKGNQSWIVIERIDVEAETPILWPPDAKSWLTGKKKKKTTLAQLRAGEEGDDRGWDGCMASLIWWTWVQASSRTGSPGMLQSTLWNAKNQTGLSNWTELSTEKLILLTVEKTLESPLDCKDLKPVNPVGNTSWLFIGNADVEAETPILCPPYAKNWLIGKDPDAGKERRQEEKGMTEDEMAGWDHQLNVHGFEQAPVVRDRQWSRAWCRP